MSAQPEGAVGRRGKPATDYLTDGSEPERRALDADPRQLASERSRLRHLRVLAPGAAFSFLTEHHARGAHRSTRGVVLGAGPLGGVLVRVHEAYDSALHEREWSGQVYVLPELP